MTKEQIKKWLKGNHTFILTPSTTSNTLRINLNNSTIAYIGGLIVILILTYLSLFISYYINFNQRNEIKVLNAENALMESRIQKMDSLSKITLQTEKILQNVLNIVTLADSNLIDDTSEDSIALMIDSLASFGGFSDPEFLKMAQKDRLFLSMMDSNPLQTRDALRAIPTIWPLSGYLSKTFSAGHPGLDIVVADSTPVLATADGIVIDISEKEDLGNVIVLQHAMGFQTLYAHNSKILATLNQQVNRRDTIALSGNTGHSSGPHLHYEIIHNGEKKDPLIFIESDESQDGL
jgi:murein DD-endopeptidase MepM/ murein hydrolase activator NlpD